MAVSWTGLGNFKRTSDTDKSGDFKSNQLQCSLQLEYSSLLSHATVHEDTFVTTLRLSAILIIVDAIKLDCRRFLRAKITVMGRTNTYEQQRNLR